MLIIRATTAELRQNVNTQSIVLRKSQSLFRYSKNALRIQATHKRGLDLDYFTDTPTQRIISRRIE